MVPALLVPTGTPPRARARIVPRLAPPPTMPNPPRLSSSPSRPGWKPAFNENAGGDDIPFETKLQAINRLQEGLHFEDGARYTRETYRAMADDFARRWHQTHPRVSAAADHLVSERGLERHVADTRALEEEFWRIVETNVEEVKVEYGSDLDADVYGSGFARAFKPRADEDEDEDEEGTPHAWDFGEMITHPSNLLRTVGAKIPGLTRPWLYFGMMFSAFCWHVEDHYLGSVNYLHAGAPKTWYGVPTEGADAFERAVKAVVPSLMEQAPDLLHRLVTLVPPSVLRDAHGVDVFQCLQRAGEFVVTWPRAYHAGFSHGFNVGEAVNFGTAEWVLSGRAAVEEYARGVGKRDAIFSHDRLVFDAARDVARKLARGHPAPWIAAVAAVLRDELATIADEQEKGRAALLDRGVRREVDEAKGAANDDAAADDGEDDECCALCKSMPHLAVVRCARCWKENEAAELEAAIAKARAEGKSVAGAAFALLGGGRRLPGGGGGGRYGGAFGRRNRKRPVFCLRHAMDGCGHAAPCRVLRVRAEVAELREVMRALEDGARATA